MLDKYHGIIRDSKEWNCAHLTTALWYDLTGCDITDIMQSFMTDERVFDVSVAHRFRRLDQPRDPCIVLFRGRGMASHVGVYFQGKVAHQTTFGLQYQPLIVARRFFSKVNFYDVCPDH